MKLTELQEAVRDAKTDHGITLKDIGDELGPLYSQVLVYQYLNPRRETAPDRFILLTSNALERLIASRQGRPAA